MVAHGVPMALMLLAAQAPGAPAPAPGAPPEAHAGYGPKTDPPKPDPRIAVTPTPDPVCQSRENQGQIVICAPRPQGYRLDPDVMEAKREKRGGEG